MQRRWGIVAVASAHHIAHDVVGITVLLQRGQHPRKLAQRLMIAPGQPLAAVQVVPQQDPSTVGRLPPKGAGRVQRQHARRVPQRMHGTLGAIVPTRDADGEIADAGAREDGGIALGKARDVVVRRRDDVDAIVGRRPKAG